MRKAGKENKRNQLKRFLAAAGAAALAVSFTPGAVWAQGGYTYSLTLYAGNQGAFTGDLSWVIPYSQGDAQVSLEGDKVVVRGLEAGDVVTFQQEVQNQVALTDGSRYYVQGLRLSGRDNDSASTQAAVTVGGDADYVVAYGIQGEMVAYTVNYLDEEGNTLLPSQTYYGNIGDKPVVAYQYVEGYMPQALSLTKTLSANEAENVFDFTYREVTTEVLPGETIVRTTVVPGTTQVVTTQVPAAAAGVTTAGTTGTAAGTTAGTAAGTTAGTAGAGTGAAGTDAVGTDAAGAGAAGAGTGAADAGDAGAGTDAGAGADAGTVEGPAGTEDTPEEILDEDTPLGQIDLDDGDEAEAEPEGPGSSEALPIVAGVGIGAAALAALGAAAVLIRRHLRK